jgi:chloramphenicol-sensitive protein RarD
MPVTTTPQTTNPLRAGIGYALLACAIWGVLPIYWKLLAAVPAPEILAHRMVWSLGFIGLLLLVRGRWAWMKSLSLRVVGIFVATSSILALNWGLFIWAVNNGYLVEASLGYFINPLINIAFGSLLLGERPRPAQWGAIGFAATGVLYLTLTYGQPPILALTIGTTFAIYSLLKKKADLGALEGLGLETALLFFPALGFLIYWEATNSGAWGQSDWLTRTILAGSGIATALPLLLFSAAVRRLTLTLVGLSQYISPTLQFFIGVFVFAEPFSADKLIGFACIWLGLLLYTAESLFQQRITPRPPLPSSALPTTDNPPS